METIILAIRLGLRRAWRSVLSFFHRNHLDALPPVKSVALVLIIGVLVPLSMGIDTLPAELTTSLARERLELFLKKQEGVAPAVAPGDAIYCERPAFHWPKVDGATRYRFRLSAGDTLWIGTDIVDEPRFVMPMPGRLEVLTPYHFRAIAVSENGRELGSAGDTFTVQSPSEELVSLRQSVRDELEPTAAVLVMAGYYAEQGWAVDTASALEAYLRLAPDGASAELALRVLSQLGYR